MSSITPQERNARLDIIIGAIAWLIANPEHSTTGAMARDSREWIVSPLCPEAHSFCAMGRLLHDLQPPELMSDKILFGSWELYRDDYYAFASDWLEPLGLSNPFLYKANDRRRPDERIEALAGAVATLERLKHIDPPTKETPV